MHGITERYLSSQKADAAGFFVDEACHQIERNEMNVRSTGVLSYIPRFATLATRMEQYIQVNLVGDIISLPGSSISEALQTTFSEFLKRLTDRDFGVCMSVLEHAKSCLLSNPLRPEAPQII
ncbi:hypothetical protein V8G54_025093 [Vigna mungo]|uniref:Uncharacterized protein n=1 Tax=Vigna mungo TaxID=3915 RepID=A0AAQ3N7E8_VIGMU